MITYKKDYALIPWSLFNKDDNDYSFASYLENDSLITLTFSHLINKGSKLFMTFDEGLLYCQITNESFRLQTIKNLSEAYGEESWLTYRFYIVENSPYLNKFKDTTPKNLKLFMIIDHDAIIELITFSDPIIKRII
jgi:hypothetical protein